MSFLNRVGFLTTTTGTGAVAISAALPGEATPANAGATDGQRVGYVVTEGDDFEVGIGTYSTSGPAFSRDVVEFSQIGGTPGTSLMDLGGGAKVRFTATAQSLSYWAMQPLGVPIPIFTNLFSSVAAALPPNDNPFFTYIWLTAGETGTGEYNEGKLTSESVSGSAPLVIATAVIDFAASPLYGETVNLINTERRVIRAGSSGNYQADALQNITGFIQAERWHASGMSVGGAFTRQNSGSSATQGSATGSRVDFDASLVARTDTETRAKNIGADLVLRIA